MVSFPYIFPIFPLGLHSSMLYYQMWDFAFNHVHDHILAAIQGSSVVFHVDDGEDSCRDDFYLSYTVIVQGIWPLMLLIPFAKLSFSCLISV